MAEDLFVIVTARNEAERISATLAALALAFPHARVFVADDGSTDATARLAGAHGARVVRSERAVGKGGAATLAARAVDAELQAVAASAQTAPASVQAGARAEPLLLLCDADLGESAQRLAPLVAALEQARADVAVAAFARRLGGGFGLALGFARWAIRRRCGLDTVAPISGQRALRAGVLDDVLPFARGFGMELAMTIDAVRAGHRVVEIELDLDHRASARTVGGFAHRARQLADFVRAYMARG